MRIKQTITMLIAALGFGLAMSSAPVYAVDCGGKTLKAGESCCGGVITSIISCPDQKGGKNAGVEQTGVWGILLLAINILTAGVGVAAVGGILYASVLYTTAGGNMDQTKRSKVMIVQTVLGIGAYALMYAFLNFLIPGGLFK